MTWQMADWVPLVSAIGAIIGTAFAIVADVGGLANKTGEARTFAKAALVGSIVAAAGIVVTSIGGEIKRRQDVERARQEARAQAFKEAEVELKRAATAKQIADLVTSSYDLNEGLKESLLRHRKNIGAVETLRQEHETASRELFDELTYANETIDLDGLSTEFSIWCDGERLAGTKYQMLHLGVQIWTSTGHRSIQSYVREHPNTDPWYVRTRVEFSDADRAGEMRHLRNWLHGQTVFTVSLQVEDPSALASKNKCVGHVRLLSLYGVLFEGEMPLRERALNKKPTWSGRTSIAITPKDLKWLLPRRPAATASAR